MSRDKTDDTIIEMLKKDSRQSFVEIGEKLGLSESAVRRRVKNLTDGGTIKTGDANSTSAIILISVDSSTDTSKVSAKLSKLRGVHTVFEITGQYDIAT